MRKIIALLLCLIFIVFSFSGCKAFFFGAAADAPEPPEPRIKEGEFPFEIVYEIDGQRVTMQDVYVCRYAGSSSLVTGGKVRYWKGYVKSTGERSPMLLKENGTKVMFFIGDPEYYMGDDPGEWEPEVYYVNAYNNNPLVSQGWPEDDEELLEDYGIKIISYKLAEPIENSFE